MTKNQIELIKAREMERANRAQEELANQGQNKSLIGSVASSVFKGLATTLLPHGKAASAAGAAARTINNYYVNHNNNYRNKKNNSRVEGGKENGK